MSLLKGKNSPQIDEPEIDDEPDLTDYEYRQKEVYKQALLEIQDERDRERNKWLAVIILLLGIAIALFVLRYPEFTMFVLNWLGGFIPKQLR